MNKKYSDMPSRSDPNYLRIWRQTKQDKEKRALYTKTYYEANKERLSQKDKERYQQNPKLYREARWRKAGIKNFSYEDYLGLLEQDNTCRICNDIMQSPKVDHDHNTGVVRGLLCDACNKAIGLLKDNPTIILKAHEYLTSRPFHK